MSVLSVFVLQLVVCRIQVISTVNCQIGLSTFIYDINFHLHLPPAAQI